MSANHVTDAVEGAIRHALKCGISEPGQLARIAIEAVREEICAPGAPPMHVFLYGLPVVMQFGSAIEAGTKTSTDAGAPMVEAFKAMANAWLEPWDADGEDDDADLAQGAPGG